MLDIRWIRDNPDILAKALTKRGSSETGARAVVDDVIERDEARRAHIVKLEEAQARRNAASKEIGKAKAQKDDATAARLMAEVAELKTFLSEAESKGRDLDKALNDALAIIPNVPLDDVPVGPDEHANVKYREWGAKPGINDAKEHFELGEALGGMDFEAAAKLSGARFVVLKGELARMERALGQFMLDLHTTEHGYTEVQPPLLVRDAMRPSAPANCRSLPTIYLGRSIHAGPIGQIAENHGIEFAKKLVLDYVGTGLIPTRGATEGDEAYAGRVVAFVLDKYPAITEEAILSRRSKPRF